MAYGRFSEAYTIAKTVLDSLHIQYRRITLPSGSLCFCTLPGGQTFDLFVETGGTIRLWCFIGTLSADKAGARLEYRKPECPGAAVGLAVTEEGDLSLFAERTVAPDDSRTSRRIRRMVACFSAMLQTADFQNTEI